MAAAAAGKEESVSLSLFISFHSGHACLGWLGKEKRAVEGLEETDLRSADMEASERTCRSCDVRDP